MGCKKIFVFVGAGRNTLHINMKSAGHNLSGPISNCLIFFIGLFLPSPP